MVIEGSSVLSVVTPVLNAERYIDCCVHSVLSDNIPVEQIVVDGCSNDGTYEKLIALKTIYGDRLKIIRGKDNSMTEALQKGILNSCGTYLAPLNADDYYSTNTLSGVVQLLTRERPSFLVAQSNVVEEKGRLRYLKRPWIAPHRFAWLALGCITPECGVFFSRAAYEEVGGYDAKFHYAQDYDLYLRLLKRFRAVYYPVAVGNFRISNSSISYTKREVLLAELERVHPLGRVASFTHRWRIIQLIRLIFGVEKRNESVFELFQRKIVKEP